MNEAAPAPPASAAEPVTALRGLPNPAYTDPAWLARERRRIFAAGWSAVAASAEVPAPGDLLGCEAAGTPLLLARGADGTLYGFHNVCSHRGALLVAGAARERGSIRCPYHGWAYGLDGRLRATPHIGGHGCGTAPGIARGALGLKPLRVAEWGGLVFADPGGRAPPLAAHLAPLARRWAAYPFAGLVHGASARFTVAANWKLVLENFVESYHLPWVHPALNTYSRSEDHYDVIEPPLIIGQGNRTAAPPAGTGAGGGAGVGAGAGLPRFPGLDAAQGQQGEFLLAFPNAIFVAMPDHYATMVVTPLAPDLTAERFDFWFLPGADPAAAEAAAARWIAINREDIAIVERLQQGRRSPAFDGGVLVPHWERPVAALHALVAERLGAS